MLGKIDKSEISRECYEVGALLYSPANSGKIINQIKLQKIAPPYSVALCLEDAVADSAVEEAEQGIYDTLNQLAEIEEKSDVYIPKIFIRVRHGKQIMRIFRRAGENFRFVHGFILPKYSPSNADAYNSYIIEINTFSRKRRIYMMPILESKEIISLWRRADALEDLRGHIDVMRRFVLNMRVGGNDFCRIYGLRRNIDNTIYDMGVINTCLMDILNVFSDAYVVSAPVWEYFDTKSGDNAWEKGLRRELKFDILNGFIGKTVIHPSQVPVVNEMLKVTKQDYEDACSVANWNNTDFGVGKTADGNRMNEVKCHQKWAKKILTLADIYGIRDDV